MRDIDTPKQTKLYEKYDVVVYAILLISLLALFLVFVVFPKEHTQNGFKVLIDGKTVLTYQFINDDFSVLEDYEHLTDVSVTENGYTVTIYHSTDKTEYNKFFINKIDYSAKMIESTCSISKDCVRIPAIHENGSIYCAPHKLNIIPLVDSDVPIVG